MAFVPAAGVDAEAAGILGGTTKDGGATENGERHHGERTTQPDQK